MRSLHLLTLPTCLLVVFLLISVGCSSGIQTDGPTSPTLNPGSITQPLTGQTNHESNTVPLGFYELIWEPGGESIAIQTLRTAELSGDVTGFLTSGGESWSGLDARVIDSSRFESDGIVRVEISITHPLDSTSMTLFDVMGVVTGSGSKSGLHNPNLTYAGGRDVLLVNADGYTDNLYVSSGDFFDVTRTLVRDTASINGFRYFAGDIGPTEGFYDYLSGAHGIPGRGAFRPGTTITRDFILRIPDTDTRFGFAILAHWSRAVDTGGSNIENPAPGDFPSDANASETFIAACDTSGGNVWYTDDTNRGGDLVLDMNLWNWQAADENPVQSLITQVVVEAPSGMIPDGYKVFEGRELADSFMSCCGGDYSARLKLEIQDVSPSGPIEQVLITVITNVPGAGEVGSYYHAAVLPAATHTERSDETVRLLVILDGTPETLYNDAADLGDLQFGEIRILSDQIKSIYRTNRESGVVTGLQSQVTPLVSRILLLKEDRAAFVRDYIQAELNPMQDAMTVKIEALGDTSVMARDIILNSLSVETTTEKISGIEALDGVYEVIEDRFEPIPNINNSARALKLRPGAYPNVVWDEGYHGEGIDVMAMDTGVYTSHSALSGISFQAQKFPTYAGGCSVGDDENHGTCVCGIIASQELYRRGMAYGLETYYNAKMCDGSWPINDTLVAGYNWAGLGGSGYNDAEIVNFSMGFSSDCSSYTGLDPISSFIDQTVALYDVIWSVSAGNRGQGCPTDFIRDKPAVCYNGFSVAGIKTNGTADRGNDTYYDISKHGPVKGANNIEDRLKPDIATYTVVQAPGYDGGWYWFGGTSAAAPHMSGTAAVLMSAGVTGSLDMRALVCATAEDFQGGGAGSGVDYYTGFGNVDAWAAYSHIADTYSGTLSNPSPTDFYEIENVQAGDRVVLVYNKHGSYPSWQLSNLDIEVYDKYTQVLLYETTKTYENKEYIEFDSGDAGLDVIIHAHLTQLAGGLSGEAYSISANTEMIEASASDIEVEITQPAGSQTSQYKVIEIEATVTNDNPISMTGVAVSIDVPTGWELVSGANPQSIGTIPSFSDDTATWEIFTTESGPKAVSVTASGTVYSYVEDSDAASINAQPVQILSVPTEVEEEDIFTVDVDFENLSDGAYSNLEFDLDFDGSKVSINSGDNPNIYGSLASGNIASVDWDMNAVNIGNAEFSVDVDFDYGGAPLSFTTEPETVTIVEKEDPSADPYKPTLIAPHDGTVYILGNTLYFKWDNASGTNPSAYYMNAWLDGTHSPLVPSGGAWLAKTTSLMLDQHFIELYAGDGEWEWAIGAQIGGTKYWSDRWTITKQAGPALIIPKSSAQVFENQFFNWDDIPGAVNYVARVTGLLPGNTPYYLPLNSANSYFVLEPEFYALLKSGVTYTWAISGTYVLGATLNADDQATLSRLSYSEIRSFSID